MSFPIPQNPTEAVFFALVRTTVLIRRVMDPLFAEHGLSGAQFGVLRALQRAEQNRAEQNAEPGIRATELSSLLLVRPPSLTSVVSRLHSAGLIRRTVCPDDHRAKLLQLTPAGRRKVEQIRLGHASWVESLLQPLKNEEREGLAGALTRIANHLDRLTLDRLTLDRLTDETHTNQTQAIGSEPEQRSVPDKRSDTDEPPNVHERSNGVNDVANGRGRSKVRRRDDSGRADRARVGRSSPADDGDADGGTDEKRFAIRAADAASAKPKRGQPDGDRRRRAEKSRR